MGPVKPFAAAGVVAGVIALMSAGVIEAQAQMGLMNEVIGQAIQMQRQQQYLEHQRRAAAQAERERAQAAERARKEEQSRLAAEKKAEEQRQAAEAAARRRAEALQRVVPPAEQLVAEVSDFLKANPSHPQMLAYVEALGGLTRAIKAGDPAGVEKQTLAVSQMMQKDSVFAAFAEQRAAQRRAENARTLAEAVALADRQKRFLLSQIAQNPTGASTEAFLALVKRLDQQAAQPDPDALKTVTGQADIAIRQAGLRSAFMDTAGAAPPAAAASDAGAAGAAGPAISASAAPPAPGTVAAPTATALAAVLTEKNRFLLEGGVDDVVFVYNASSAAPHVLRNLKGDIVFEQRTADVCLFQRSVQAPDISLARRTIAPMGLDVINIESAPCAAGRLTAYDVLMVRRSALFREDQAYVFALLKHVEAGAYAQLVTLSGSALAERSGEGERRADEVERQSRPGFGLILVSNPSATVCVVAEADRAAHQVLLGEHAQQIAAEIGAPPRLAPASLDTAFASLKRAQCAAVYADAAGLKGLAAALRRDGAVFQFSGLWFEPGEVAAAEGRVSADQAAAEKAAYEQRRAAADAARVAALREAEEAKTRAAREAALRAANGKRAEAAAILIGNDVKLGIETRSAPATTQFPIFYAWLSDRLADKWEVFSVNTALSDFGSATWKGRTLEAGFVQMNLKLRNTVLGEYKSYCFIFGRLADHEFQVSREPGVQLCEDTAALASWKRNLAFSSLWIAQ